MKNENSGMKLRLIVMNFLQFAVWGAYTLTDGMSGRRGEKYPTWFVEGTAQLAGGGFSTGYLRSPVGQQR